MGEAGNGNLYAFVSNVPVTLFDAFGLIDCDGLKRDIERWQDGIAKLDKMYLYYKPGQTMKDYGLVGVANAAGWRSGKAGLSDAGQEAVDFLENSKLFNYGQSLGLLYFGAAGSILYGNEQLAIAQIRAERVRARIILGRMEEIYKKECWCPLRRIKDL